MVLGDIVGPHPLWGVSEYTPVFIAYTTVTIFVKMGIIKYHLKTQIAGQYCLIKICVATMHAKL